MFDNPFSLKGKTILVTGASSGIGKAVAVECSKMGARIIITGRNLDKLKDTSQKLEGDCHKLINADLTSAEDINFLIDQIPSINGLVHCAGITDNSPFQFATKAKIDKLMNVNFYAPIEITRRIIKTKKMSFDSSIVFISSISGVNCSSVALSIYSASKGAINGMLKGIALDLASKGIRVNSVNPGIIQTNIFSSEIITKDQLEEEKKRYPLNSFGSPQDVAYAVIYLLSDASKWVTGTNLLIDGGFTLQ